MLARIEAGCWSWTCPTGVPASSPGCPTWRSARRAGRTACTTRRIRPARGRARSAATWPRTPAAPHCLKYGVTTNHVVALEVVLPDGRSSALGRAGDRGSICVGSRRLGRDVRHRHGDRVRLLPLPERCAPCSRISGGSAPRAKPCRRSSPPASSRPALEMMDGLRSQAVEAAIGAGLSDGRRSGRCWSRWTAAGRGRSGSGRGSRSCCASAAREVRGAATPPSARRSGAGARRRSAPWGGSPALRRAGRGGAPHRGCRRCCAGSPSCRRPLRPHRRNVFHAGDGNLHPHVLSTPTPGRQSGPTLAGRSWSPASTPAASSPASTASGSTRRATCRSCSPRTTSTAMQRLRRALQPRGALQPGQGVPHPAPVGEVPGPYRAHPLEREGWSGCDRPSPGDLVCTVLADVALAELNAELARQGQMLALDPPGADRLTVGAVFDGALSGPRSHRYGDPRDLVLGLTVELADGTVARSGGRVVKNVAGYDLGRLFTGARGRLGRSASCGCACTRCRPTPPRWCPRRSTHARWRRWRRPASSTPGRRAGCWSASRARSRVSWAAPPASWSAASWWRTTSRCGPGTASWRRGWVSSRACPRPRSTPRTRSAAVVRQRSSDGWGAAACRRTSTRSAPPDPHRAAVIEAFGG